MYFPYLNNRRAENLCLRALSERKFLNNVIPIVNTIFDDKNVDWKDSESIDRFISSKFKSLITNFFKYKNKIIITINKTFLDRQISIEYLYGKLVEYTNNNIKDYCIFGIFDSNIKQLDNSFFNDKSFVLLHEREILFSKKEPIYNILLNQNLLLDFSQSRLNNKVVILDAFEKKSSNKDYVGSDPFSNGLFSYRKSDFLGFGDYTILPKDFLLSEGGNMRYITVAIHLIYEEFLKLYVQHYICTPEEEPIFQERVKCSLRQIAKNSEIFYHSYGLQELLKFQDKGTNLTKLKELSMAHHIESMNFFIK